MLRDAPTALCAIAAIVCCVGTILGETPHEITIDGNFDDWAAVPSRTDPAGSQMHGDVPDVHDTDHETRFGVPDRKAHPDVDILEYKFTHDETALYAYFRSQGQIGRTQTSDQGRAGRYYVIVTIDVDDDDTTGYWLHEGGYYPTSRGYDMNMEIEFYDGEFNTGHYLNHGARNELELERAIQDQLQGLVRVLPGSYDFYSQWVWWNDLESGEHPLPDDGASITMVEDRGPVHQGVLRAALSPDGHQIEMVAPFEGFMKDSKGRPIVSIGKTLDVSFSLEASGELAPDRDWASDTAHPIVSYRLEGAPLSGFIRGDTDASGDLEVSDPLRLLNFLLLGQPSSLDCAATADANGDSRADVSDAVYLLLHLFAGGAAPVPPFPECGGDPASEPAGCVEHEACAGG